MSAGAGVNSGRAGEIKKQIHLPLSKAFEIAIKAIRIRFWRSMITAAGIFLGIAFFTSVRVTAVFTDIQTQIIEEKRALVAAGKLKPTIQDIRRIQAAAANPEEQRAARNRLTWLSIMGLIVCTVGITNAMLMSVTERYKEIGTMKCLGALDRLIVELFFIESCLLGFIASVAGFVIGWFLISLIHLFTDGLVVFNSQFWSASFQLAILSSVLGTVLTFVATIVPAIRAAQMPPAAALRVEI